MSAELLEGMRKAALLKGYLLFKVSELGGLEELMLAPWVDGASRPEQLLSALAEAISTQPVDIRGPSEAPYGRQVYLMTCLPHQYAVNVLPRYVSFHITTPDPASSY